MRAEYCLIPTFSEAREQNGQDVGVSRELYEGPRTKDYKGTKYERFWNRILLYGNKGVRGC